MTADDREIKVASESDEIREPSALRTALIGSTVVFWILAIFMIHAMNSLRSELKALRGQADALIHLAAERSPGQYRVVDPQGNVIYSFERIPARLFDQLDSPANPAQKNTNPYEN